MSRMDSDVVRYDCESGAKWVLTQRRKDRKEIAKRMNQNRSSNLTELNPRYQMIKFILNMLVATN